MSTRAATALCPGIPSQAAKTGVWAPRGDPRENPPACLRRGWCREEAQPGRAVPTLRRGCHQLALPPLCAARALWTPILQVPIPPAGLCQPLGCADCGSVLLPSPVPPLVPHEWPCLTRVTPEPVPALCVCVSLHPGPRARTAHTPIPAPADASCHGNGIQHILASPAEAFQAGRVGKSFSGCPLLPGEARQRAGRSGGCTKENLPPLASSSLLPGPLVCRTHPAAAPAWPCQLCCPAPPSLGRSGVWPHRHHLHFSPLCSRDTPLHPWEALSKCAPRAEGLQGKSFFLVGMDSPVLTKS